MGKSAITLIKRLQAEIDAGHIRKAEVCRSAGFSSSQLEAYLSGRSVPGLDAADRIADTIGEPLFKILSSAPTPKMESKLPKEILQHVDAIAERAAERLAGPLLSPLARTIAAKLATLKEDELGDVGDFIDTILGDRKLESPRKSKKSS